MLIAKHLSQKKPRKCDVVVPTRRRCLRYPWCFGLHKCGREMSFSNGSGHDPLVPTVRRTQYSRVTSGKG